MTNQHTPRPWKIGFANGCAIIQDESDCTIAECPTYGVGFVKPDSTAPWNHAKDNARLIAAAPELLEALQQISVMPELKNAGMGTDAYHAWLIAHQAIHKAQGN